MNRIKKLFQEKKQNVLSVYFTAGYPYLDSTELIIQASASTGIDMMEIGMPFSDPMADGPVIQNSSNSALKNGMNMKLLFKQLRNIRKEVSIPLLLMGYLNPVLQYGFENFCKDCSDVGIDGVVLPDMPLEIFENNLLLKDKSYASISKLFKRYDLENIFLISPQTNIERIKTFDKLSDSFLYFVSSSSTTGIKGGFSNESINYFKRIHGLKLNNPSLIGFGISDKNTFNTVCKYSNGAIIGSAFVKMLSNSKDIVSDIKKFTGSIKGQ